MPPSHPKDPYSAKSRYIVEFNLKNIGNFPALCVDISAQIIVPKNNDVIRLNASASLRIDALEPSQIIKYDVTSEEGLLFSGDDDYSVLNALIETELEKYPQLLLKVYYRNLLGGCFIVSNVYALYPEEDNDPVLKNWITQISSFSIQYKNELNTLKRIEGTNQEQWTELFDKLNEILKKSLTDKEIMLNPEQLRGSFRVKSISKEEYDTEVQGLNYFQTLLSCVGNKLNPSFASISLIFLGTSMTHPRSPKST